MGQSGESRGAGSELTLPEIEAAKAQRDCEQSLTLMRNIEVTRGNG